MFTNNQRKYFINKKHYIICNIKILKLWQKTQWYLYFAYTKCMQNINTTHTHTNGFILKNTINENIMLNSRKTTTYRHMYCFSYNNMFIYEKQYSMFNPLSLAGILGKDTLWRGNVLLPGSKQPRDQFLWIYWREWTL